MSGLSVAGPAPALIRSRTLAQERPVLEAIRLDATVRQLILGAIVQGMQELIPGFGVRRMRYEDFLRTCEREGIKLRLVEGRYPWDGTLSAGVAPPLIRLRGDLADPYRTFVAFHELAHWVAHPRTMDQSIEDGTLGYVEREAMGIGYLALRPHRGGPPWPLVESTNSWERKGWCLVTAAEPEPGQPYLTWKRRKLRLRQYVTAAAAELGQGA